MKLEKDPTRDDRWLVKNDLAATIGMIHRIGPTDWRSHHFGDGQEMTPVPLGPYETLDAAFEAFALHL